MPQMSDDVVLHLSEGGPRVSKCLERACSLTDTTATRTLMEQVSTSLDGLLQQQSNQSDNDQQPALGHWQPMYEYLVNCVPCGTTKRPSTTMKT